LDRPHPLEVGIGKADTRKSNRRPFDMSKASLGSHKTRSRERERGITKIGRDKGTGRGRGDDCVAAGKKSGVGFTGLSCRILWRSLKEIPKPEFPQNSFAEGRPPASTGLHRGLQASPKGEGKRGPKLTCARTRENKRGKFGGRRGRR